jgi:peptidoglycan/LPS O-acetylase OafA/YrhL
LILLFLAISIWDAFFRPGCMALALAGLAAIMVGQSGWTITTFFSIDGVFYLAPYFLFGIILRENPAWLRDPSIGWLALGVVVIVLTSQQLGLNGLMERITLRQLPAALAGMAGVVFLLQRFPGNRLLATIGGFSYAIYLWHPVYNSAARAVLSKAGMVNVPTLFLLTLAAAVTGPIVMCYVSRGVPFLCVAITGETADRGNGAIPVLRRWRALRRPGALGSP